MKKNTIETGESSSGRPIMVLLDVMGQRWALRILWELRDARLTFRDLQKRCDDVSPTSLNTRLKELRALELVDHNEQGFGHTKWGRELGEHLLGLSKWSAQWAEEVLKG